MQSSEKIELSVKERLDMVESFSDLPMDLWDICDGKYLANFCHLCKHLHFAFSETLWRSCRHAVVNSWVRRHGIHLGAERPRSGFSLMHFQPKEVPRSCQDWTQQLASDAFLNIRRKNGTYVVIFSYQDYYSMIDKWLLHQKITKAAA